MRLIWTDDSWERYVDWQSIDKKTTTKINKLIKDIKRSPYEGLGKPEPLKHEFRGFCSRRIDEYNRLIYRVEDNTIEILSCFGHYDQD
ncbi:MAG: Txe/YoeB family addiction module toxin [Oscillospiraceae bacterium]|jgi:toxin YoeB|nr:Txe/YoeB family addiction module toxin [Oscillospiraceae bacterium]